MYDALPKELLHIILDYSGKIKYRNGKYINTIDKADPRYDLLDIVIAKKCKVVKTAVVDKIGDSFYIEFSFNNKKNMGLCYASGGWSGAAFTQANKIEICYFIYKNTNFVQHRTYF